ncbi:DUF1697 domain-containing protein [Isoptericola dokdonensis]|uniref:DUF1697 domain-containing protein n=1 Tax=Isoptericola dokdonensis DS-3 TaxID=1300344 RepID=A0A168F690_9MICO|nr:DUF1697 domain-containing protein [Isoptericola dokdonensis]ANC30946.1 hypothetical protein I598_1388 [Isoptericola dokdonensis DS-3]
MTTYAVLLRGVNVGGHRRVPAADLRAAADAVGLGDPRTYATSGNLVVTCDDAATTDQVAHDLTTALADRLGLEVQVVAVAADRLARLLAAVPFPDAARDEPAKVLLHVGPRDVDAAGVARLADEHTGPERVAVAEGALYVHHVDGVGRSRLTGDRIDRAAGTWTTGRSWRTVIRLLEMAAP